MHLMYFTEQPMAAYPEDEGRQAGITGLLFSNRHFNREAASRLYDERLEEYLLVEEVGYDGIMLNEHQTAPFCMQAAITVWASILAAVTKRVKIVLLGYPLPVVENPVRVAQELAMIDSISKGRLVSGFVRGGGVEQIHPNANPAFNRARFEEAHDLIIKTWTEPGPFRWEGDQFQQIVVNPLGAAAPAAAPAYLDPGGLEQRDHRMGGRAPLSVHRVGNRPEATDTHHEHLRRNGAARRVRAGARVHGPTAADHCRGHGGESGGECAAVHVDAGRVHGSDAPGLGRPVGLPRRSATRFSGGAYARTLP